MQIIKSLFETSKCCRCKAKIGRYSQCGYDPKGERGQKVFCLSCAGSADLFDKPAEKKSIGVYVEKPVEIPDPEPVEEPVLPSAPPAVPVAGNVMSADPLARAIAYAVEPLLAAKLDSEAVKAIVTDMLANRPSPTIRVEVAGKPAVTLPRQHKQFEQLLRACSARDHKGNRLNVWITGSAGTGKTSAAEFVAQALGLEFASTGSIVETYKLFGSPTVTGEYFPTEFRKKWQFGGIFILDDFDGSDPAAAVEFNNALANGYCTFPDGVVKRHHDCVIILTANTWGQGATTEYVGRCKQDAAFADRFAMIDWEIDEELELATVGEESWQQDWCKRVQDIRANVRRKGIRVLVTPRATYNGVALLAAGLAMQTVLAMTVRKGMTAEQWASVC